MTTVSIPRREPIAAGRLGRRSRWLPLAILPATTAFCGSQWQPWLLMWALAVAIYGSLKWLSFVDCRRARSAPLGRVFGYLLLWPGMDGEAFFGKPERVRVRPSKWAFAIAKTVLGVLLVFAVAPRAAGHDGILAGWIALFGIVSALHFGLFDLLALGWQSQGVAVRPIMNAPLRAGSLSELWGRRWNLGFRDLAHVYVFRPLAPLIGAAGATLAVFAASGAVHDVVISGPARGGWGLPTLYFLLQGLGVLLEHSRAGRSIGLARGAVGRLFAAVVAIGPLPLLFHRPFVERIVLPMLTQLTAR